MPLSRKIKEEPDELVVPLEVPSFHHLDLDGDDDDDDGHQRKRNENEENDEVVREIDVLLSPELYTQMYLMQYPLHHHRITLPESARIRPRHRMIELEQKLPSNSGNEGGFRMSHRTYVSRTVPVSTHLAVGKMEPPSKTSNVSRLFLVPLSNVMQMRPSFTHIDESMANATRNDSDNDEEMEEATKRSNMEKKPVLLHKKESDRAATNRRSSYAFKKASEDSEEWKSLVVFAPRSKEQGQILKAIQEIPTDEESIVNLDVPGSYVQSLNYLPMNLASSNETTAAAAAAKASASNNMDDNNPFGMDEEGGGVVSNPNHAETTLCVALVGLLRKGLPVPYGIIKSNFPETDDATLFTVLNSCAVLVRGNYILQSRLLPLPPGLQRARTFLLYLFQAVGFVSRPPLVYAFEKYDATVTSTMISSLLQQLGEKVAFGWICKVGDNVEFCQTYPEQALLNQQYWERQTARFERLWRLYHHTA